MKYIVGYARRFPRLWSLTKGIIIVIPASLIGYAAVKWTTNPLPGQDKVRAFFEAHPWLTIGFLICPMLLPHLFAMVDTTVTRMKDRDFFPKALSAALIYGVNDLVGLKLRRFADFYRRMNGQQTKADVFDRITQPEEQMTRILENLHHLLREMTHDDSLQIVLARIERELPVDFVGRVPKNLQLPPALLTADAPKTLFHHCAHLNRVITIADIEKHVRKRPKNRMYHPIGQVEADRGSILCYPVFCEVSGNVEYVLSIKSDEPHAISEDFKKSYKVPIESFMTRFLLEHNLSSIKGRAT